MTLRVTILVLVLLMFVAVIPFCEDSPPGAAGEVLASVNGSIITMRDLYEELARIERQAMLQSSNRNAPLEYSHMEELTQKAITMLIEKELLLQECRREKITARDEEVNLLLEHLKGDFPSEAQYRAYLGEAGIEEGFLRREIEHGIMIQRLLEGKSAAGVNLEKYIANLKQNSKITVYYQPTTSRD